MRPIIESIQQSVKPHDQYQVEIKLDYGLLDSQKTRYTIETFIFAPPTLGITAETYKKSDFYRDVQNYIRLKTPPMVLRDFTQSKISPLVNIKKHIGQAGWVTNDNTLKQLDTLFKLFATMLHSAIREHLLHAKTQVEELAPGSKSHLIVDNLVEEFLVETELISQAFREMFTSFHLPHVPETILDGYRLTDESISILIEEGLVELFEMVEQYTKKSRKSDFQATISDRVHKEGKHRLQHGYLSILDNTENNETYLYQISILKKYADSVLFLSFDKSEDGLRLIHLGRAIAAGVAMIFATLVAFYFQSQYGPFTLPVFVSLVIGYMFKDRIKEVGRDLFSQQLEPFLYDRRIVIRTQEGVKLGYLKEKVDFITESQAPRLVILHRNQDQLNRIGNDGQGESIIRHTKEITLYTDAFRQIFDGLVQITGINDILRYDIRAYLNKMSQPIQARNHIENNQLTSITCHKVYHLNIISRYKTIEPQKAKSHSRIRIILDQTGIQRMETVLKE